MTEQEFVDYTHASTHCSALVKVWTGLFCPFLSVHAMLGSTRPCHCR